MRPTPSSSSTSPSSNEETGEFGLIVQDDFIVNPFYSWPAAAAAAPELLSDAVVVFKNFLVQATGTSDLWAAYVGWSGSGNAAWHARLGQAEQRPSPHRARPRLAAERR
jgi:hypothetical protein